MRRVQHDRPDALWSAERAILGPARISCWAEIFAGSILDDPEGWEI